MALSWRRKDKQRRGFAPPQPSDLGVLTLNIWVEDTVPEQPLVEDPEEEFAEFCPNSVKRGMLSRALQLLSHMFWFKDATKKRRVSRGAKESPRATVTRARGAQRCAELERKALGLEEEREASPTATHRGEAEEKKHMVLVPASTVQSVKDVGCKASDTNVQKGDGGHRDGVGQTQRLVQSGSSRDEGRTTGSPQSPGFLVEHKVTATIPGGDGQNSLSAERRSEEEQRRQVWEKLQRLGENMARWEGKPTRDLAARLTEVILKRETNMYPTETGNKSDWQEHGQRGPRARLGSSNEVGTRVDVTMMQQCPWLQDFSMYHDDPISISGTVYGDNQHIPTMLEPLGKEQILEDSDDDVLEQGDPPDLPSPAVHIFIMRAEVSSKEQWREEFPDVWARYEMDCGRVSGEVEVDGGPVPFEQQKLLPPDVEDRVASILKGLLEEGVVVKGRSPFNSPLKEPIKKKDGKTWRLKVDYKAVDRATPMVEASVSLDKTKLVTSLSPQSKYFSMVDLSNASFAIPLAESSRARFAFTFREQQYLFTRLPQGFHSTTSIIHRRVAQMLSRLPHEDKPWILSYVDDILIAGRSQEETQARTRRVLELIRETGFKAKLEKAQLVQPRVDYLGMTIGAGGREIQASKQDALSQVHCPQNVKDLSKLLGRFVNMQDHIPGYWELAWPLQHLTKKEVRWEWGAKQERVLKRLQEAVLNAPALRFPDKSRPFIIRLTPGERAVGAAVLQEDEQGRLVPVRHSSRLLKDHQVRYTPEEKGCLAALWAVQELETLVGPATILLEMPRCPGTYLLWGDALGSSRVAVQPPSQWALLLVDRGVKEGEPTAERGSLILEAPPLRDLPPDFPESDVWFLSSKDVGFAAANLEERWLLGVAEEKSELGAALVALWHLLCRHRRPSPLYLYTRCHCLVEGLRNENEEWELCLEVNEEEHYWPSILDWICENPGLLHVRFVEVEMDDEMEWARRVGRRAMEEAFVGSEGNWARWEPSKHERQEIVAQCHGRRHEGLEGTLARVRLVASWDGDHKQVLRWVQNCPKCTAEDEGAGSGLAQRVEGPWSLLRLGHISGLTESEEGHRSLLVVEDEFSGWVDAFPLQSHEPEEVAEVLCREVLARYGTPRAVHVQHAQSFLWLSIMIARARAELPWDTKLEAVPASAAVASLQHLAWGAGREWVERLPLLLATLRAVRARGATLGPYRLIPRFPLVMRWCGEPGGCPRDNVLSWLARLWKDNGHGYINRTKTALQRGYL